MHCIAMMGAIGLSAAVWVAAGSMTPESSGPSREQECKSKSPEKRQVVSSAGIQGPVSLAVRDLLTALDAREDLEIQLIAAVLRRPDNGAEKSVIAVTLLRPGKNGLRQAFVKHNPEQHISVRLVKITSALVKEPCAIATYSSIIKGDLNVAEVFLRWDQRGGWTDVPATRAKRAGEEF